MLVTGAPLLASRTLMLASSWLTTQMVPSGARARVRGLLPTAASSFLRFLTPSMAVTLSLSGFTTQTRLVAASYAMELDAVGRAAGSGLNTVCRREQVVLSAALLSVTTTG